MRAFISSAILVSFFLSNGANPLRGDIYQWEYIDPADPSQGKRQSTMLAPDGAGVDAVPGADLSGRDLSLGYLADVPLRHANLIGAVLTWGHLIRADISGAKLIHADFLAADLTDANFTGAEICGASFKAGNVSADCCGGGPFGSGITLSQLYSTYSYQAHELIGIDFSSNDLAGGDFSGQNLANVQFVYATLTDADFREAAITDTNFSHANLVRANFAAQSVSNTTFSRATLVDGNFSGANLRNASFSSAALRGTDFTGAAVSGSNFGDTTSLGFTYEQLSATSSFQLHDLTGINLSGNDLRGWNLAAQNLAQGGFVGAYLTNANLAGANVRGANFAKEHFLFYFGGGATATTAESGTGISPAQLYSTASYDVGDLSEIDLSYNNLAGVNLANQKLTNANFSGAVLTDANFAQADIRGASFSRTFERGTFGLIAFGTGLTIGQIYSTASYQARDLSGIGLAGNALNGVDFSGQKLTNSIFGGIFSAPAVLIGANLTGADARGATRLEVAESITANLILPDGHIAQLNLGEGELLLIRDYDGNPKDIFGSAIPPIPIVVDQDATISTGGRLRMVLEADAWDSTISFAPGIPVTLGGTLELTFAADVNVASQIGRTFDLFDWTGVDPSGAFAISSLYRWDLSKLYSTGEVTFVAVPEPASLFAACLATVAAALLNRRSSRRLRVVPLAALFALTHCGSTTAADRVYSLVSYFDDPQFAISGTIRTDGSLGYFLDTSFIKDWSITVRTPSLTGGVVDELFTPALGSRFSSLSFLEVTESHIVLMPSLGPFFGFGQFLSSGKDAQSSSIHWRSGHIDLVFPTRATVRVCGAGDNAACATTPAESFLRVASGGEAIPEPTSLAALLVGTLLILLSRRAHLAVAALVLILGISPAYADLPMTGRYVPEFQAIDTLLQSFMVGKPIPGGTIAITHNDKVIYERGFGYSDAAKTIPMQETVLMRVASVSKPVTASAIHQLAKDGQISLKDKVFNIDGNGGILSITPYNGTLGDSRLRDITLQHLLEHKGGWNRDTAGDLAFQDIQIANAVGVPSPPGIVKSAEYILSRPLQFAPGTDYNYSNIGYMFLGMVVEEVSGESYESYVDRAVLAPAGIPDWEVDAGRTFAADQNPREPYYSAPNNTTRNVYDPNGPRVPWPYGGWDHEKALAYGGLIASSKAIALMAQNRIVAGPEIGKLRSDFTTYPEYWWGHGGLLDGTDTAVIQSSTNDWTYSILLDRRPTDDSSYSAVLVESLQGILDGLGAWPAPIVYAADFTNDQWLTLDDITLFNQAIILGSETSFTLAYPEARYGAGDFDGNGLVNAADASGLIGALQHAGVPPEYIALVRGLPGDYDFDGDADGRDFLAWQRNPSMGNLADWQANYGEGTGVATRVAIPEPCTVLLLLLAIASRCVCRPTETAIKILRKPSIGVCWHDTRECHADALA